MYLVGRINNPRVEVDREWVWTVEGGIAPGKEAERQKQTLLSTNRNCLTWTVANTRYRKKNSAYRAYKRGERKQARDEGIRY